MRRRISLAILLVAMAGWNAALVAAPVAEAPRVSALTYLAGALLCHQRPERSFHRNGAQFPVCARCAGLYAGAALGVVGWLLLGGVGTVPRGRARRWLQGPRVKRALVIAALPTVSTVALAAAGLWDASNTQRFLLALPLGAVVAAVVAAVAAGDLR